MHDPATSREASHPSDAWASIRIDRRAGAPRTASWRRHAGNLVFVLGFVGGNLAIGYVGWTVWRSNQPSAAMTAPLPVEAHPAARPTSTPQRSQRPSVSRGPSANSPGRDEDDTGTMRWTRRDGLTIEPGVEWRCVGGFHARTTLDDHGTSVVTLRQRDGKPVRC